MVNRSPLVVTMRWTEPGARRRRGSMGTHVNGRRGRRAPGGLRAGAGGLAAVACALLIGACGGGTDETANNDDKGDGGGGQVTLKAVVVADEQAPFETAVKAF